MENKAGIYLMNNNSKILIGHPTAEKNFWSIPKGKIEKNETSWECCLRETYEETNIDFRHIELEKIYELPSVKYTSGKKRLYPFLVTESENSIDFSKLEVKCNSIVSMGSKWNAGKPEFDDFKFATIQECRKLLHNSQISSLDLIEKLFKTTV